MIASTDSHQRDGHTSDSGARMDTNVRTPLEIFNLPQHLVIPLFQRPYVWDETEQWLPLWRDVRRLAELRLSDPGSTATHFLGAVVIQAQETSVGDITARNVIDGQQRLTTLQLLMDATGAALEEAGRDTLAGQLEMLTHNLNLYVTGDGARLKVRHTNRDREAFDEVMNADPPVDHESLGHSGSRMTKAHRYFAVQVSEWLGQDVTSDESARRATALVQVLTRGLQLVVIDLQAQENSQEIFETLNARGTPLTAADLVKNLVFQRLEAEDVDTLRAYAEDWPFDTTFWESDVSVGRYKVSRSSLFLNQWLGSRLGEEVSPKSTFTRFKHYVDHEAGLKMSELLARIKEHADRYEGWHRAVRELDRELSRTELAVYRMQASSIELLAPVLMWLHDPELAIPQDVANDVIGSFESWVYRRQLLLLQSADLGRIVAEVISLHRRAPVDDLASRVRGHLSRLATMSTYWPGDDEVRAALITENAYVRFRRSRLRMFLEAIEDRHRAAYDYPPVPRRGYPIEHVLPQSWQSHWPVDDLEAELARGAHVHRLGNLTLLTAGLNSAVSNGPWSGPQGKRAKLAAYDAFLMNRLFQDDSSETWNEQTIDERSGRMIEALLATWPVPAGHAGRVVDPVATDEPWVNLKQLLAAGLLIEGDELMSRPGQWADTVAYVLADGRLELQGRTFDTPSGAGGSVRGGATNGWKFWRLVDGRTLADLRAEYRGEQPAPAGGDGVFDWSRLHALLEALPSGQWTSYGDLANAVGTAPQPLGNHITSCTQCVNAHRVLTTDGRVADAFRWADPEDRRDPAQLLRGEGVPFARDRAAGTRRLSSDGLAALVSQD